MVYWHSGRSVDTNAALIDAAAASHLECMLNGTDRQTHRDRQTDDNGLMHYDMKTMSVEVFAWLSGCGAYGLPRLCCGCCFILPEIPGGFPSTDFDILLAASCVVIVAS